MPGMFGDQRGFGGTLGVSPMQRLAGGIGIGFGGQKFPQLMVNEMLGGRGRPGVFGGGMDGGGAGMGEANNPSMAQLLNMQNLDMLGNRQFVGSQAELDRDLSRLLQQRQLQNNMQLANVDQATQFGVQDRRNTGAIDQINASGGWERNIQGDRLSSNERLAAAARALDEMQMRGNWEQGNLDRGSREKMGFAELQNAIQRQQMVNSGALDQIGAEGDVRTNLQRMMGDQQQAIQDTQERGAFNRLRYSEDAAGGRLGMELRNRSDLTDREIAGRINLQGMGDRAAGERLGRELTSREKIGQMEIDSRALDRNFDREDRAAGRALTREGWDRQFGTREERADERLHTQTMRKFDLDQAAVSLAITQANQKLQAAKNPAELAKAQTELKMAETAAANLDLDRKRMEAEIALTTAQAKKANTDAMSPGETMMEAAGNPALATQLGLSPMQQVVGAIQTGKGAPVEALKTMMDSAIENYGGNQLDFGLPGFQRPFFMNQSGPAADAMIKILETENNIKIPDSWKPYIREQMKLRRY